MSKQGKFVGMKWFDYELQSAQLILENENLTRLTNWNEIGSLLKWKISGITIMNFK
jgi:hypothetical protein